MLFKRKTSLKYLMIPKMLRHGLNMVLTKQEQVNSFNKLSNTGQIPKKPKISCQLLKLSHQARKENQSSMSLKQLVILLKITVSLVNKKGNIMPTSTTKISAKSVIISSKLDITLKTSKELNKDKPYHIYLRNLWIPHWVNNSKLTVVTSLIQKQFKMLDGLLNTPTTQLLKKVTSSIPQKNWKKLCKVKDSTSTSKKIPPWWTCKNSSKSLNFLKNGKVWSLEELRRKYLRPMFDLWIFKN